MYLIRQLLERLNRSRFIQRLVLSLPEYGRKILLHYPAENQVGVCDGEVTS